MKTYPRCKECWNNRMSKYASREGKPRKAYSPTTKVIANRNRGCFEFLQNLQKAFACLCSCWSRGWWMEGTLLRAQALHTPSQSFD